MNTIIQCKFCGNTTNQEIIGEIYSSSDNLVKIPEQDGGHFNSWESLVSHYFFVIKCSTCKTSSARVISLVDADEQTLKEMFADLGSSTPLTPEKYPFHLPEKVAKCYNEAMAVKHFSSAAFASMLGRTLEAAFQEFDFAIENDTLEAHIRKIEEGHPELLSKELLDIAKDIKFLRNKGAHFDGYKIDEGEVRIIIDFIDMLLSMLFLIPKQKEKLKQLRANSNV